MAEFGIKAYTKALPSMINEGASRINEAQQAPPSAGTNGGSFIDSLKSALGNVNETITNADKAAQKFASGGNLNLHDVMIAMEKADLSLRTLSSVRGKVVEAYQEIMKMPV